MTSALLRKVWSHHSLERAWHVIQENSRTSKSDEVRKEVEIFREEASKRLRSLSGRLSRRSFAFSPARGIPIPKTGKDGKPSKDQFRPIVLAKIEDRIVQRSILDALLSIEGLAPYIHTRYSFGGIRKRSEDDLAAVPAAVKSVLHAIGDGANFVLCADIASFFTNIPKPIVTEQIRNIVRDDDFLNLFSAAITVELSNLAELREKASAFPIHEIGVAQGNSLSPLLGNILLYEFDQAMNTGDCNCIRYIDDVIILAPTSKAAKARLKKAECLLKVHGLKFGAAKTTRSPIRISSSFEFLGIEFSNGLIRPTQKAQRRFIENIENVFIQSEKALRCAKSGQPIKKEQSLLATLRRIDGIANGWGKHYRFCNDTQTLKNLDLRISEAIRRYIGIYSDCASGMSDIQRRRMLGVDLMVEMSLRPFAWPKRGNGQTDRRANDVVGLLIQADAIPESCPPAPT